MPRRSLWRRLLSPAGDYDTALHYYEKYMEIDDKNPEVIYDMGMVYKS